MGYSCRADASKVLDLWGAKCVTETGSSNTYLDRGSKRFFEIGREQDDGAITGTILKFVPAPLGASTGSVYAKPAGTFKVGPYGAFVRGPAFLKALCEEASKLTDAECSRKRWSAKSPELLEKV